MGKKFFSAVLAAAILAIALPAFASSNPFMDVPANHWAYDAVAQLASRGVISGYPDGSYKGGQPATRYEMASTVARMLAKIDMEKAGKQDLELLKKLVLELKDELDALGVKVDKIDGRLKVMEKDLGGWSMSGELRFDAMFGADEKQTGWYEDDGATFSGKNEFDLNRYRLYINKRIDERTVFAARLGAPDRASGDSGKSVVWQTYYVSTMLPYGIGLTIGRVELDVEGFLGFYSGNDGWDYHYTKNMMLFNKDMGMASFKFVVTRNNDGGWSAPQRFPESFLFAGVANFQLNEQLRGGVIAYHNVPDKEVVINGVESDTEFTAFSAYMAYAFTPSIELKGMYYHQKQGDTWAIQNSGALPGTPQFDDKTDAWKIILDVKQEALKFSSLWLEYARIDNNFAVIGKPYAEYGVDLLHNKRLVHNTATATLAGAKAEQRWNDKWSTSLVFDSCCTLQSSTHA